MLSLASRRSQLNHFATPLAAPNHEWGLYKIKKAPPRGRGQFAQGVVYINWQAAGHRAAGPGPSSARLPLQ